MPTGPRGEKRPADAVGCAVTVAKMATGEIEDTRAVRQPNKAKGGRVGGKARATGLSREERSEIAAAGAAARWAK